VKRKTPDPQTADKCYEATDCSFDAAAPPGPRYEEGLVRLLLA